MRNKLGLLIGLSMVVGLSVADVAVVNQPTPAAPVQQRLQVKAPLNQSTREARRAQRIANGTCVNPTASAAGRCGANRRSW